MEIESVRLAKMLNKYVKESELSAINRQARHSPTFVNDELWGILVTYEIAQAFINFGNSSVLALGSHPYEENWPLGINNPYHSGKIEGEIDLIDNTMPTTGNKPQHTAHIINPFTGAYSKDRRIISIIAKNAIDAEALSTTMIVAGKEVALAILSHFSIDNRLVFNL